MKGGGTARFRPFSLRPMRRALLNGGCPCQAVAMKIPIALVSLVLVAAAPAPTGFWAGDGMQVRQQPDEAIVQIGCEWGKTRGPIVPDGKGAFTSKGYLNAAGASIKLTDIAPRDRAAVYSGTIAGKTMTMVVQVAGRPPQTFKLKRGARLRFPKCIEVK